MTEQTEDSGQMPSAGHIYLGAVIVFGITAIAISVYGLHIQPLGPQWYMLAALTLVSGSATVQLPSVPASISVSETFVFASVLLFGPSAGTVMVALDGLVISFWMAKRRPEWYRALFNMAAPAGSIWCAAHLLFLVGGIEPLIHQPTSVNVLLLPLVVFALVYFGLNSWLIAFAVAFETRVSAYRIWRENFLWLSLNYFSGASVALLLVVYTRDVDLRFIGVIVPLLLVLYFTFKTSMQRVEDSNRHLKQLNRLHLSTIETLAMAIDAKDQITHGHIRRVQTLAVRLAGRIGVADEQLIKAIEAAALLHDMGKLAVPEYILNKPGKLTAAEFEKMKAHATVGADILSAIDFPYPVTPIVRHHHENWDGTGYPSGLKGTDIPIGARVLSVVDCFDALTSDRPYRPRLSDNDALKILMQRRASMYDPLIVDTFIRVHEEIAPEPVSFGQTHQLLNEIASSTLQLTSVNPPLDEITASSDEMLTLYELAGALAGQLTLANTGDAIVNHLRRLIPFSLCVLYLYDVETDELEAKHAVGEATSSVKGLRIALGQRLSGWVGANRQTIVNSDPVLDLGDVARGQNPRLRSCLSAPLIFENDLIGVLSLYSDAADSFNEDHRRIIEVVAGQTAHALRRATEFDGSASLDPITGLPSLDRLEHLAGYVINKGVVFGSDLTLLFIKLVKLRQLNENHGRVTGDEALRHVVRHARSMLRAGDLLFRCGNDELVALLNSTDQETGKAIGQRISDIVCEHHVVLRGANAVTIKVTFSCTSVPPDWRSLRDSLATARIQNSAQPGTVEGSSVH